MKKVATGLDVLLNDYSRFKGNVALLCHNASIDADCVHAVFRFKEMFGERFIKIFGPQHGFSTDAQDNMIETDHSIHPYFKIPIYSLYSETRVPTDAMLKGVDHIFVDLQDIGCRMYTYIYTLTLLLEKCADKDIEVIVLDRPNPLGGITLEGNVLEQDYASFIGRHPIPVRHGLTIAEVAKMHQQFWVSTTANLDVIKMKNWHREQFFEDTKLPWPMPSPNISRTESTFTFPSMVLFEGTNLSEGRGTTQPLELIGHPKIEPFSYYVKHLNAAVKKSGLKGFTFRPLMFLPTFHKHANVVCGGFQLHVLDKKTFSPWRAGQLLVREIRQYLGENFEWLQPPYEYIHHLEPIDIINGTDKLRHWVESNESIEKLDDFEHLEEYKKQLNFIKLY